MSQAAIEWLEDEEVQHRITVLRDVINGYSNYEGLITVWSSMKDCLEWLQSCYYLVPSPEEIAFVDLKSYFRE